MLTKPTARPLQALVALRGHPAWDTFMGMLQEELDTIKDRLTETADLAALHRLQGRAQVIKELQQLVDQAPQTLSKFGHTGL